MARQVTPEERERARRGGEWLREQRRRGGYETGTSFADALGIKQVRLSSYENGAHLVEIGIARRIAEVLGLSELEVWRGLELPLPREVDPSRMSRREVIAYVEDRWPGEIDRILSGGGPDRPGPRPPRRGNTDEDVTRTDEPGQSA